MVQRTSTEAILDPAPRKRKSRGSTKRKIKEPALEVRKGTIMLAKNVSVHRSRTKKRLSPHKGKT
jgi:hypothetical protein